LKYPIDKIIIPQQRKRTFSDEKCKELAKSIEEIGLHPIVITENGILVSGLHRLKACELLGWREIDCVEKDYDELDAELAEIDENLVRIELTTLERAEHLKRRKEIYEAKYPEAKRPQGEEDKKTRKRFPRFLKMPLLNCPLRQGQLRQEVQIAEKIVPDVKEVLANTELANSKRELLKIAQMEPELQRKIAQKIITNEAKSVVDARRLLKRDEVKEVSKPDGKYRVIYADPPWCYNDKRDGNTTGAEDHYPSMTIQELCELPVKELAEENAVLFLWVTSPMLEECFQVIKEWGFKYKTSFVWDKVKHNMGHYNSVRHEFLLICTKGSCLPDVPTLFDSVISIERSERHSEKPEKFREIIDTLYPYGRRIELFARKKVPNWDVWGNEA
jgi:N6-adenosine-specific RNA methylase IME4/ParB-like chromosome segregation protein Spo0J